MILPTSGLSINDYLRDPFRVLEECRCCPCCDRPLGYHARYRRSPIVDGKPVKTMLFRLRCSCGRTFTLLPDFLRPRERYPVKVVGDALESALGSDASVRRIAVEMSGLTVAPGPEVSITDALQWPLRPRPSYQRIFGWQRELCAAAKRVSQAVMAWILRLHPDHGVLHQLAADTDWIRDKGRSDRKRVHLQEAARLRKLMLNIPELGGGQLGWYEALNRFVQRVLGGFPSRAPPTTHGET